MMWKKCLRALATTLATTLLVACSPKPTTDNTIRIASKPMTEQFILAEMLGLLIEQHSGLKVSISKGIGGGTSNIHPALLKGEFDLYPEYTGTSWLYVLKQPPLADDAALFKQLNDAYQKEFALEWVGLYGFNNTYGLAVRKEIANKHGMKTYSDLAPHSASYRFGAEYDFYERSDGYDALAKTYGFQFKEKRDLDIGLKYAAINNGQIDVMNIFTTDGQLTSAAITVLQDDRHFYPNYYAGTVVRSATLQQHPELRAILLKMDKLISNAEMAAMNHAVESDKRNEKDVAADFLRRKGLIQ